MRPALWQIILRPPWLASHGGAERRHLALDRNETPGGMPGPATDRVDEVRAITRKALHPTLGGSAAPAPKARRLPYAVWLIPPAIIAAAGFLLLSSRHPAPAGVVSPAFPLAASYDETELLAQPATDLRAYPFRPAQAILVLLYPSLHEQALAMNRIGAFVEKAGLPRDRVLDDAALDTAITAGGDHFDTYYFGHDYRAADLARFFATAAANNITLRPQEATLRTLLQARGLLNPGATGAIITLPPFSTDPPVDEAARATILRHELSHGLYFTSPDYAAYTAQFWNTQMSQPQRETFRAFLGREGYDTTNDDLIRNEMQAYLVHTADPRFFSAASLGLPQADVTALRQAFIAGMPPGWLRDRTK